MSNFLLFCNFRQYYLKFFQWWTHYLWLSRPRYNLAEINRTQVIIQVTLVNDSGEIIRIDYHSISCYPGLWQRIIYRSTRISTTSYTNLFILMIVRMIFSNNSICSIYTISGFSQFFWGNRLWLIYICYFW